MRNDLYSVDVVEEALCDDKVEQIWCGISVGNDRFLVGCIYRPPNSGDNCNESLIRSILKAKRLVDSRTYNSLLITGDFNLPEIHWSHEGVGSVPAFSDHS